MILPRSLYNDAPPERRTRIANNPTLLYSWWCTIFSLVIIGTRLAGRYIRNDRLFREDKIMAGSIVPLLARMALIHVVLIWGTNNVDTSKLTDPLKIHHREIGAKLVIAARIFYTMFIWMAKFTVSEFLKRMTERFWKKGYELGLRGIRVFLVATFVAVLIATLSECRPFTENWQVVPEAKPTCRQGYGHLLTMGTADIVTDLLLILFPIPIILKSSMSIKRKLQLVALFSMSIVLVIITAARIPLVIGKSGLQQYRTVWASSEILAATGVSNAIILGSFLRDRGIKKTKYKPGSATDSMDRRSSTRRTLQDCESDEDLARSLGYRTNPELMDERTSIARPAQVVDINLLNPRAPRGPPPPFSTPNWQASKNSEISEYSGDSDLKGLDSEDPIPSPRAMGGRRVSFFDVGGLLESGPVTAPSPTDSVVAQDFAPQPRRPSRSSLAPSGRSYIPGRRTSRFSQHSEEYELGTRSGPQLQDIENMLAEKDELEAQTEIASPSNTRAPTAHSTQPLLARDTPTPLLRSPTATSYASVPSLQDAGGLLS
ncbi:uncharacterized protein CC84DRAFT_1211974 [Paraphaeosphaeria sporulosa]|uniref:Rhodopsin domain-containing protein n=1 Tax=Paraphaeosphaeria sporulosa TaxID=1460663 RepID=A0A177CZ42_9PLEO|nr:uncharacterized protein CC84DRAFT_1211974 [Paraphaeosphaeria sporulosa]OAG12411.1 hypothetical protein CC84DRAFT_1211974 [Paraphaeosphaeria sporulosa]